MDNRRIIFIVVAVIAVLFLFNPFGGNQKQKIPPPRVTQELIASLKQHLQANYRDPKQYITDTFKKRDIVFLGGIGDSSIVKEQVDLIVKLIPMLHKNGIYNLGIEHALREDQAKIDALLTASTYDEEKVKQILFNRHVMWGYKEYADIFKAAWQVNKYRDSEEIPFRILGLTPRHEWQHLQTQKDIEKEEIQKKILSNGLPSVVMAESVQKEIVDKGEKGLILCSAPQVYTGYQNKRYIENTEKSGFSESRSAGNIIFDKIGSRAATILVHYPWPDDSTTYRLSRPCNGAFDVLMSNLEETQSIAGFDTSGTPFGDLPVDAGVYSYGYKDLTLKGLCDGYIILGPLHQYTPVTPILGFITEKNLETALKNFPAPKDRLPSLDEPAKAVEHMNGLITLYVDNLDKVLTEFKLN
jgi:hypothetical protein